MDGQVFFRTNGTNVVISEEWVLPVPVSHAHSLVRFSFVTSGGDISFSMVFMGLRGEEEVLVSPTRVNSDVEAVEDEVRLSTAGTLILLWDNSYSWLSKKELSYSLQIEQDPEVDANGLPRDPPLSALEDARTMQSRQHMNSLNTRMTELKQRLSGVDEIILSVDPQEIEKLEASLLSLKREIKFKRSLLAKSLKEKEQIMKRLQDFETIKPPIYIRSLSGKVLANVLEYLPPRQTSLVCKYWCQLSAYNVERRENPELTDEDFEILFDYESSEENNKDRIEVDNEEGVARKMNGGEDVNRNNNDTNNNSNDRNNVISESQSLSDVPGSISTATAGDRSFSEGEGRLEEARTEVSKEVDKMTTAPSLKTVLNSLAEQDNNSAKSSDKAPTKKVNINDYPDDIKQYLRASLSAMSRMEGEKAEVRSRIDQWKLNFERRHHRPPSDQEKLNNIGPYFHKYSKLKRSIKAEEEKVFTIANAIDKLHV